MKLILSFFVISIFFGSHLRAQPLLSLEHNYQPELLTTINQGVTSQPFRFSFTDTFTLVPELSTTPPVKTAPLRRLAYETGEPLPASAIYNGKNGKPTRLEILIKSIHPGSVVIISEIHNNPQHHENQLKLLNALSQEHPLTEISIGMEFFSFTHQSLINNYLSKRFSEKYFLEQINWGALPFEFYRPLVQFSLTTNGWTYGINAPRFLTSKVSKNGLEALSESEKKLLPPNFKLGRAQYFERFKQAMSGGHKLPDSVIENYFAAQSIWDDTMAYNSLLLTEKNPQQILVIIVGDFHNIYGGGLPDRLLARGVNNLVTISQVDLTQKNESEKNNLLNPHPLWGPRADFIWTSNSEPAQ